MNPIKQELHKRALDRLEQLVDLDHIAHCERVHDDLYAGRPVDYLPCTIGFPVPDDWPTYGFRECWDDIEKNFVTGLGFSAYLGAVIRDDRLLYARPDYGVVNVPELFGVPSVVTDEGRSMSEGLNDTRKLEELLARGMPDLSDEHTRKVDAWYEFARDVLAQYEKLSRAIHFALPDTQGPFDLACLVYGSEILTGVYDHPELVHRLLDLVTETFIAYNMRYKQIIGEPMDSGYHICGLKLVRGGVRICDDSATLASAATYREFSKPYNVRAFEPFDGGWVHFCGNGNHILHDILTTPGVRYLHMGNPDDHDLVALARHAVERGMVIFWSGSLDRVQEALDITGRSRIYVLTENRYASKGLEEARTALRRVRAGQPIPKAEY